MKEVLIDPELMVREIDRLFKLAEDRSHLVAACRCVVANLGAHGGETPAYIDDEYPPPKVANAFFAAKSALKTVSKPLVAPSVDGA